MRSGRPVKLTDDLVEKIRQFSQIGMTWPDVATFCEIGISTVHRWRKIGEKENNRRQRGDLPNESRQVYVDFWNATLKARLQSKYACIQCIYGSALGGQKKNSEELTKPNWIAAAWLLERIYPDEFSALRRSKLAELADQMKLLKKK